MPKLLIFLREIILHLKNLMLPVIYFWLFQWCLSAPHRSALWAAGPAFITVISKLTIQATYIWCNTKAHSCSLCCIGKAISITYSECAFVALGILHATHMHCIVVWCVWLYNIFPHYLINGTIFEGGGLLNITTCVAISSTISVWNISHSRRT